jgi:cytoskeletal protein RodZ
MNISKKLGLLAIPVVAGLGAVSVLGMASAHAATQPITSAQQSASSDKEVKDATEAKGASEAASTTESPESSTSDGPNGPNVEQVGQNETAN